MGFDENIIRLFNYHNWANQRLLAHIKTLPHEVYSANVESVFPSISATFEHMYQVDELWFVRVQGGTPKTGTFKKLATLDEAEWMFKELQTRMEDFLTISEDAEINYTNSKGEPYKNRISEILQHIVNHGTYHRGNIAAMIRQQGHQGIGTDFIAYLRQ